MSRPSKLDPHAAPPPAAPPAPASAVDAPSRGYTDFILRSTAPSSQTGIKYNIMKFAAMSDRSIDPADEATFPRPVRLNRKDPRTVRRMNDEEIERINRGGDELMEDGTVVKGEGEDVKGKLGKKVKEEMDVSLVGTGTSGIKPTARSKGNMFKKKTNRVFVSSEEARRLKREEWMPWVLEDASSTQRWIGRLEGGTGEQQKSSSPSSSNSKLSAAARSTAAANAKGTGMSGWRPPAIVGDAGAGGSCYVAFVFPEDGMDFKVYPANRWYKFGQGPKYVTLGTEDAEEEVSPPPPHISFESNENSGCSIIDKRRNKLPNDGSCNVAPPNPPPRQNSPLDPLLPPHPLLLARPTPPSNLPTPALDCKKLLDKPPFRSPVHERCEREGKEDQRRIDPINQRTNSISRRTFRMMRKGLRRLTIWPTRMN